MFKNFSSQQLMWIVIVGLIVIGGLLTVAMLKGYNLSFVPDVIYCLIGRCK